MGDTQQPGALAVFIRPGQVPELAQPVPPMALVSLDVLLHAQLREFLTIDGSTVEVCGHRFRIVAWEQDCLLWEHQGPVPG